jgi:hypothetical protein
MPDLEARLRALGADTRFPPTPDLAAAVRDRLVAPAPAPAVRRRRRHRHQHRHRLALAIALVLLVPAGALAAVPSTRHAILEWLGLRSVRVLTVPTPPAPGASVSPSSLGLGRPITLDRARGRVSFTVRVPAVPGPPPRVFFAREPPGGRVSLLYAPRRGQPRLLVTEFRGSQTRTFLEKILGPGAHAERVRVNGDHGAWLTGRPHAFIYADAHGVIRNELTRLAGNVLLWEHGGVVLRLEGGLRKPDALRIARSFH